VSALWGDKTLLASTHGCLPKSTTLGYLMTTQVVWLFGIWWVFGTIETLFAPTCGPLLKSQVTWLTKD